MRILDTRGLSCPQPVLLVHQALGEDNASPVDVLVDNEVSMENVTRAAKKQGWTVSPVDEGDVVRLELRK